MPIQVNSTIKTYFEIVYDYHQKVMFNEYPRNNDFYIERMFIYLEDIKDIYNIIDFNRTQADKNYVSAVEFMCKEMSKGK